jgi:hypothetical protein
MAMFKWVVFGAVVINTIPSMVRVVANVLIPATARAIGAL